MTRARSRSSLCAARSSCAAEIRAGDRVTLLAGRLSQRYVVTARREVGKSALAARGDVFSGRGAARLVLIMCTGRFDASTRHYDKNLLVIATPVGRAVAG